MDPVTLLIGAGILLTGGMIGNIAGRRRVKAAGPPKAKCEGCDHNLSFHDESRCHGHTKRDVYDDGEWIGTDYVPCTCQQYVGPIPADRMLASFTFPAISSGEDK